MQENQTTRIDVIRPGRENAVPGRAALAVAGEDLAQLNEAIDRWERFLDVVFSHPSTRKLDEDRLERLSMEDAERYLDVKIQLSRCFGTPVIDEELQRQFDERFSSIRQITYHYITKDLPALCENSRSLMALARGRTQPEGAVEADETGTVSLQGVDPGLRYKDKLVLKRQKLKVDISRQQVSVIRKIAELRDAVGVNLRPIVSEPSTVSQPVRST